MINPKDVTIIIPHLGGSKEAEYALKECLLSLDQTIPDANILLVVNGNECEDEGHRWRAKIRIDDQGQCKAVNAAAAITNTPWIFVTNDDMIYAPGWWEALTNNITWQPCISPKLIEPRPGAPTFEVFFAGGAGGDFDKDKWLDFAKDYQGQGQRTGFNLPYLITRKAWDTVGGYDINYDPWGSNSDSDLEYKLRLAGIQPMQQTDAIVYHFSQTSGTFEPRNQSYWQKNWDYFIEKWGFPRTDEGIWEATFEIPDEGRKFRPEWEGKYAS